MVAGLRVHPLAPVIGLDIDGTMGDYYGHFKWFAELYLRRQLEADWQDGEVTEFSDALKLPKEEYRQIKLAYRQGGMKRCMPAYEGVRSLVVNARYAGIQVWICTTRPWNRLDNIDPDTQFWISHELGRVDGVIYGEEKYEDLIDIVGRERILGIVDDLPENTKRARELQIPALLRIGEHNKLHVSTEDNARNSYGIALWVASQKAEHDRRSE